MLILVQIFFFELKNSLIFYHAGDKKSKHIHRMGHWKEKMDTLLSEHSFPFSSLKINTMLGFLNCQWSRSLFCSLNFFNTCWARNYGVYLITRTKMLDDVGWSLNKFKFHATSSNTYPTCLIVLFERVKPVASNKVWPTCLIRLNEPLEKLSPSIF